VRRQRERRRVAPVVLLATSASRQILDAVVPKFRSSWTRVTSTNGRKPRLAFSGGTSGACDGSVTLDLSAYLATHPAALGWPFVAGETLYVQGWNRDNGNGSKNLATSNALKVTFWP
jgi:hypothetical protein